MEPEVLNYIKNMFLIDTRPEWSSIYEGVILFDKENQVWIGGDSVGWIEIKELT